MSNVDFVTDPNWDRNAWWRVFPLLPISSEYSALFLFCFSLYQRYYLLSFSLASAGFLQGKGFRILREDECAIFSYLPMDFLSRVEAYIYNGMAIFRFIRWTDLIALFYHLLSFYIYNHLFHPVWVEFDVFNVEHWRISRIVSDLSSLT